jgi:hypothetical protein
MADTIDPSKTALIHLGAYYKHNPLQALSNLASAGLVADQRKELESWFDIALTSEQGEYDEAPDRLKAFTFRDALLTVIEVAHFLEGMDSKEKLDLFSSLIITAKHNPSKKEP